MGETLTISAMVLKGVGFETPRLRTHVNAFWAAFSSFGLVATIWEVESPTKALLLWCFQSFVDKAGWDIGPTAFACSAFGPPFALDGLLSARSS